jgi:hypothetical protein
VAAINQGMRFSIIVKAPSKEPDTNESFTYTPLGGAVSDVASWYACRPAS